MHSENCNYRNANRGLTPTHLLGLWIRTYNPLALLSHSSVFQIKSNWNKDQRVTYEGKLFSKHNIYIIGLGQKTHKTKQQLFEDCLLKGGVAVIPHCLQFNRYMITIYWCQLFYCTLWVQLWIKFILGKRQINNYQTICKLKNGGKLWQLRNRVHLGDSRMASWRRCQTSHGAHGVCKRSYRRETQGKSVTNSQEEDIWAWK